MAATVLKNKKKEPNYTLDHKLKIKEDNPLYGMLESDLDLKSNHIYLFGIESYAYGGGSEAGIEPGVEYIMANRFIRNINQCMRVNPEKPLLIHLKSCGGIWEEGMAIYDAIRSFPWPVTILNYTHARSMTSLIFQAGNKRVMMPNSYFMIHDGKSAVDGTIRQVRSSIKFEKRVADKTMMDIYAKSMKWHGSLSHKSQEYIKKWLRNRMDKEEDVYFTAKEAVEIGFADEIFNADWANLTKYTDQQLER